jgi:hypothetical protein
MAKGIKSGATRPPKMENVLVIVRECIENGRYLDTRHGADRQNERCISRPEIFQVLRQGYRVPSRDRYDAAYGDQGWSYAIEGKTVDNRFLRVIVAFDEETKTLIIAAVDLDAN